MNYPTAHEIRAAHDAISDDGPMANTTLQICALIQTNPILRAIVRRLLGAAAGSTVVDEAVIMGAIATGLNYGLRIHEQRMAAAAGETIERDTPESVAEKATMAQSLRDLLRGSEGR